MPADLPSPAFASEAELQLRSGISGNDADISDHNSTLIVKADLVARYTYGAIS
jgi:hypothetical protein